MPKHKQNQAGLRLIDYRMAFVGWHCPVGWLVGAFNSDLTLEQAKTLFAQQKGTRQIEGKRRRRLSLHMLKNTFRRVNERHALSSAAKSLMPDARAWLEKTFPECATLSRHRAEQEAAGAVDLVGELPPGPGVYTEPVGLVEMEVPECVVDITGGQPMPVVYLFDDEA